MYTWIRHAQWTARFLYFYINCHGTSCTSLIKIFKLVLLRWNKEATTHCFIFLFKSDLREHFKLKSKFTLIIQAKHICPFRYRCNKIQQNLFFRQPHVKQLHTAAVAPSVSSDTSDRTSNSIKSSFPAHLQVINGTSRWQDTNFVVCSNQFGKNPPILPSWIKFQRLIPERYHSSCMAFFWCEFPVWSFILHFCWNEEFVYLTDEVMCPEKKSNFSMYQKNFFLTK